MITTLMENTAPPAGFSDEEKRLLSYLRLRYLQGADVAARELAHMRFVRWLHRERGLEAVTAPERGTR